MATILPLVTVPCAVQVLHRLSPARFPDPYLPRESLARWTRGTVSRTAGLNAIAGALLGCLREYFRYLFISLKFTDPLPLETTACDQVS